MKLRISYYSSGLIALASLFVLVAWPKTAVADHHMKKALTVVEFTGENGRSVSKDIANILREEFDVVSSASYAAELNVPEGTNPNAEQIAGAASSLGLAGIVVGAVQKKGDRQQLHLEVFNGITGELARGVTIRFGGQLKAGTQQQLRSWLGETLSDFEIPESATGPVGEGFDDEANDTNDTNVADASTDTDDADGVSSASEIEAAKGSDDSDSSTSTTALSASSSTPSASPMLRIFVGGSVVSRNLSFSSRADLGDQAPQTLSTQAIGVYARADVFPFKSGLVSKLGFSAVLERAFTMSLPEADAVSQASETTFAQTRFGASARYKVIESKGVYSPTIVASVGANKLIFTYDRPTPGDDVLEATPETSYTYFDPGVAIVFPIASKFSLNAEAKGLLVTQAGKFLEDAQYGEATVIGLDMEAGAEYAITTNILIALGVRYSQFGMDFDGTGTRTKDADGDLNTDDVGGAEDRYISGFLTAGYAY